MAELLHRLIELAPPMGIGALAWANPDHPGPERWPRTAGDRDLGTAALPEWLSELTDAVRARARACTLPEVVGHCDFEVQNLGSNGSSTTWTALRADPGVPRGRGRSGVVRRRWGPLRG